MRLPSGYFWLLLSLRDLQFERLYALSGCQPIKSQQTTARLTGTSHGHVSLARKWRPHATSLVSACPHFWPHFFTLICRFEKTPQANHISFLCLFIAAITGVRTKSDDHACGSKFASAESRFSGRIKTLSDGLALTVGRGIPKENLLSSQSDRRALGAFRKGSQWASQRASQWASQWASLIRILYKHLNKNIDESQQAS